ncbi:AI-2E family transporter [Alteribacillus sp. HJP-4]|uniref:AI-2E family transporter n=1 Tax=Alteribacillus sp. HJP-4 TaxID=2775394 RepID=UPI0035CCF32B
MFRWETSSLMRFFGGRNLYFLLGVVLLLGLNILVYTHVSFLFHPFVVLIETIALPVILSVIAYYLLSPFVYLLVKIGINRVVSIFIMFLVVAGLITLLIFLIIPFLERQFVDLAEEFPDYLTQMGNSLDQWLKNSMFASYYEDLSSDLTGITQDIPANIAEYGGRTLEGVTSFISQLTSVIIAIVTLPFILFYLLKDGNKFPERIVTLFPPRIRDDLRTVFYGIDHQLGAYIQGQILVSLCIGVMMYIGFLIIGLDYALLLASIASVTSIVPYLGPAIAITPALIIAIVTSPFMLFKLIIVWTVVQLLEGKFISPQIMGKRLHIHPVTIIFILLTAGHLFGVIGIILAIPGYAMLKVIFSHLFYLFKRRFNSFAESRDKYEIDQ